MKDQLYYLVQLLLKKNRISFDKDELLFQIKSHPSYPSLHAITGVLDHFNIENIAAEVPVSSATFQQLPSCFLAQIQTKATTELVIVEKSKAAYTIYYHSNKKETLNEEAFLLSFTGILVAVEKTTNNTENKQQSYVLHYFLLAIIISTVSILFSQETFLLLPSLHLFLSISGIIISTAIFKQELGLTTSLGNAFCGGIDEKKDCDAVLSSKGASLSKNYKLSDLSILYFIITSIFILTQYTSPTFPFFISILVIPIVLYSIYYQYAIVKKWCLLCLSIVAILCLQTAIALISNSYYPIFTFHSLVLLSLIGSIAWLSWLVIKPFILEINTLRKEKLENTKFKRNFTLFDTLLKKSTVVHTEIQSSREIIFGNKNADLELTIITNPFCGHCKPVHQHIHQILQRYGNQLKVKIRFNIGLQDINSDVVQISSRLLELYHQQGEKKCLTAMDAIYNGANAKEWLHTYGNCTNTDLYYKELEVEKYWCTLNGINFTPEILINGYSFPKEYKRTDLMLFIDELEEASFTTDLVNKKIEKV